MAYLSPTTGAPTPSKGSAKDPRADNWMKSLPDLVEEDGRWAIKGFVPLSTAFNYDAGISRKAFIYGFHFDGFVKIGRSSNPGKRLIAVQRNFGAPPLEIAGTVEVPYAGSIYAERLMHIKFEDRMLKREWFDIDPQEFIDYLPHVAIAARLYADACRDWWMANNCEHELLNDTQAFSVCSR